MGRAGMEVWRARRWLPLLILLMPTLAHATTYTAATCKQIGGSLKVQTAVDSASNGDTVQILGLTFTSSVTWTNKAITVQGAGEASTSITINTLAAFDVTVTTGWISDHRHDAARE